MSTNFQELPAPLSEWEEQLYGHVTAHTEQERGLLEAYQRLAEQSPSGFVRYLTGMLLEDEERHHRMFRQIANAIVADATLQRREDAVPPVLPTKDGPELIAVAKKMLELEEEDKTALARLRKELKPVRSTTLWDLLVQIAERDTEKHLLILRFIVDASTHPVGSS
ncbi:MAG TPA: hypothetical protein VFC09_07505 [Candidatus Dormibacteraeota bacterium]|nr:hypothetical protein [Candidatus Dormibacteraeota bacterium]